MYETLLRLYKTGKLTEAGLTNAVTKGWITEEQKAEIIASVSAS
jgi:phenylpyruvate tautomerase PptA (4-oxalocrotonate tautomerase family)